MSEPRYKVGDRVRVTSDRLALALDASPREAAGNLGTITEVIAEYKDDDRGEPIPGYRVKANGVERGPGDGWLYRETNLTHDPRRVPLSYHNPAGAMDVSFEQRGTTTERLAGFVSPQAVQEKIGEALSELKRKVYDRAMQLQRDHNHHITESEVRSALRDLDIEPDDYRKPRTFDVTLRITVGPRDEHYGDLDTMDPSLAATLVQDYSEDDHEKLRRMMNGVREVYEDES